MAFLRHCISGRLQPTNQPTNQQKYMSFCANTTRILFETSKHSGFRGYW
uniref:Uncharacterized protein n=1 Tax=Arundo donax TaxID=35708 RepID=A0A0A9BQP7_ARUDO